MEKRGSTFRIINLDSQADAMWQQVHGWSAARILEWFQLHGDVQKCRILWMINCICSSLTLVLGPGFDLQTMVNLLSFETIPCTNLAYNDQLANLPTFQRSTLARICTSSPHHV